MQRVETKREREKKLVSQMIGLYCKKKHHTKTGLCSDSNALFRTANDFLSSNYDFASFDRK